MARYVYLRNINAPSRPDSFTIYKPEFTDVNYSDM